MPARHTRLSSANGFYTHNIHQRRRVYRASRVGGHACQPTARSATSPLPLLLHSTLDRGHILFNPALAGGSAEPRPGKERILAPTYKILIARAAKIAKVPNEILLCTIIKHLAQRDSTGTSVGENAVLVLNAKKR